MLEGAACASVYGAAQSDGLGDAQAAGSLLQIAEGATGGRASVQVSGDRILWTGADPAGTGELTGEIDYAYFIRVHEVSEGAGVSRPAMGRAPCCPRGRRRGEGRAGGA